jgi:T4 superinfection immunity protein
MPCPRPPREADEDRWAQWLAEEMCPAEMNRDRLVVTLYWTPTVTAYYRRVPNVGSVAVLNGLLGWTFVGWAVALTLALPDSAPVITHEATAASEIES